MKNKREGFLFTLLQKTYITIKSFLSNDLFTYASAGAYSFLLSALPIVLLVLVILIRILKTSDQTVREIAGNFGFFSGAIDISTFIDSITSIKSVGLLEIILIFSIFGMARRFFASIQQGIKIIYRKRGKAEAIKENLIVIAGEVVLIILIVLAAIAFTAGKAIINSGIGGNIIGAVFRFAPNAIIFVFLVFVYYFTPRIRPRLRQSVSSAAACTLSFSVVQFVFSSFVNMTRYNLIYGILSNVIVLLLEVYLFFALFLFFAQYQYISQFLDNYLLSRLYLLPPYGAPAISDQIERLLFINPSHFNSLYGKTAPAKTVLFKRGEKSTELYYLISGTVHLTLENQVIELTGGNLFGEFSSIAGGKRTATATAVKEIEYLQIPAQLFRDTVEVDPEMSARTLEMIADYIKKKNKHTLSPETEL